MASDKARFYLEQQVSELQNLIRKDLFTTEEVSAIARKRSDFEHIINARGVTSADFARYAEYEMNLASLTRKRAKRKGIRNPLGYTGQRKVFFVLDRGTRRFPGDLRLWMQYVEFARAQKSYKKLEKILASLLRLHPTKAELWVYAAGYVMEVEADATKARGYMQRGLRFCQRQKSIWLSYVRLEMVYISKICMRRRILGLDGGVAQEKVAQEEEMDQDDGEIALAGITTEDVNPQPEREDTLDDNALRNLANTPALTGAIPITIFDAAMKEFGDDDDLAEQFFDLITEYPQATCCNKILQHILGHLQQNSPNTVAAVICSARLITWSIPVSSAEFPAALGQALSTVNAGLKDLPKLTSALAVRSIKWLLPYAVTEDIDPDISTAIMASIRRYASLLSTSDGRSDPSSGDALTKLLLERQAAKAIAEAEHLRAIASALHPLDERFQAHLGMITA